jgi:glyoxalase family protein
MQQQRKETSKNNNNNNNNNNNKTNRKDHNDVLGTHHVTAIAINPQRNIYTQILGLKLVKLTVNFDDPTTYHLYFDDETGRPG